MHIGAQMGRKRQEEIRGVQARLATHAYAFDVSRPVASAYDLPASIVAVSTAVAFDKVPGSTGPAPVPRAAARNSIDRQVRKK